MIRKQLETGNSTDSESKEKQLAHYNHKAQVRTHINYEQIRCIRTKGCTCKLIKILAFFWFPAGFLEGPHLVKDEALNRYAILY